MKLFLFILQLGPLFVCAQTMTMEESTLRGTANFNSFIQEVRKNKTTDCLCSSSEYVVYSFRTQANKIASLCVSKNLSKRTGYLVYRYGAKAKVELVFPTDTVNSFSQFQFAHYNRGGGKQNAALYVNSFRFTNGEFTYTLHDNWNSEDDHYSKGIIINNNKTQKSYTINSKGKITGTLWSFVNKNLVLETDEL